MAADCGDVPQRRRGGRRRVAPPAPDPTRGGALTGFDRLIMAGPDLRRLLDLVATDPAEERSRT